MKEPDTWEPLKGSCGRSAEGGTAQQLLQAGDPFGNATQAALTLGFKDKALESRFRAWYDDAATAHDLQVGLWVVQRKGVTSQARNPNILCRVAGSCPPCIG